MSLEKKLREAATVAANEATMIERARCLWVLEKLIADTEAGLQRRLLIESQRHAQEVKLKLAKAIVAQARRAIVSGIRPVTLSSNQGAADADRQDAVD